MRIIYDECYLCPQEYPTLTTFFEGEIISERYPFLTRKWDASEEVDRKHWGKFPTFEPYLKNFNSDDFSYDKLKQSDEVFMRWKVMKTNAYLYVFASLQYLYKPLNLASQAQVFYVSISKLWADLLN